MEYIEELFEENKNENGNVLIGKHIIKSPYELDSYLQSTINDLIDKKIDGFDVNDYALYLSQIQTEMIMKSVNRLNEFANTIVNDSRPSWNLIKLIIKHKVEDITELLDLSQR